MKKLLAICSAALLVTVLLSACNAEDGKINDQRGYNYLTSEETYSGRRMTSQTSSARSDRYDTDTNDGVLHDVASTTGEVINDVADGAEDVVSSVKSDVEDFFDGSSDMSN